MKYQIWIYILIVSLASCKTSEANYRAAYEKTIAMRDAADENETIYGGSSRELRQSFMKNGNDTVPISLKMVSPVDNGDNSAVKGRFLLVVGQFKQKFNAQSLCERVVAAGYPDAFLVQTSEPYYYVVAKSFDNISQAADALEAIKKKAPVVMKDPVPFILKDPR